MAIPVHFQWTSASRTDVGSVRERNEDAVLDEPERGLWAVADGMGGHAVGDYASRVVVDTLSGLPTPLDIDHYIAAARQSLQTANRQIQIEAAARRVFRIGSTVALLLACGGFCACLWAGDSRVYLCRDGRLRQLTRDHSQAELMRAQGLLRDDEEAPHLARNTITRAVGAAPTLEIDEVIEALQDGDIFLLCSDGLSNVLSDEEMTNILVSESCRDAVETLVNRALAQGSRDNISAVVARAEDLLGSDKTLLNPDL